VTTRWDDALSNARFLDDLAPDWRRSFPIDTSPGSPCSGPRCSRNSPQPVTVPHALPQINAWCCLDPHTVVPQADSKPFSFDDDVARPSDHVDQIARPPWS